MMHAPLAIANAFIERALREGYPITHMKIQKLVYIAHGWSLGIKGEDLINERVMAWRYGPVIDSLWHQFRYYGRRAIDELGKTFGYENRKIVETEPRVENDDWADELLKQVWTVYGHLSAIQLSKLTHREGTPWHTIASQFDGHLPKNLVIPNALIQEHYKAKWEAIRAKT